MLLREIHSILLSCPRVGVYKNESASEWIGFKSSLLDYFNSREDPRTKVSEEIEKELLPHRDELSILS